MPQTCPPFVCQLQRLNPSEEFCCTNCPSPRGPCQEPEQMPNGVSFADGVPFTGSLVPGQADILELRRQRTGLPLSTTGPGPTQTGQLPGDFGNGNGIIGTVERTVELAERVRRLFGGRGDQSSGGGMPGGGGARTLTAGPAACGPGEIEVDGMCEALPTTPGVTTPAEGAGQAVMGRFGVAMRPFQVGTIRGRPIRRCLPGMVLGEDNLCYNKRDLRKSDRKWKPGRKPLLTGGEMNAITTAARAARRVKKTRDRLIKLGLLDRKTKTRTKTVEKLVPVPRGQQFISQD